MRRFSVLAVNPPQPLVAESSPTTTTTVLSLAGDDSSTISAVTANVYRKTITDDGKKSSGTDDGQQELDLWRSDCVPDLGSVYCLNGGSCFSYTIGNYTMPSCVCADGFMGERCDHKYTNRSYGSKD